MIQNPPSKDEKKSSGDQFQFKKQLVYFSNFKNCVKIVTLKNPFVFALILTLASCGNFKHSNFNRQKYTDLKTKPVETKDSKIEGNVSANTEYTQTNTESFEQTNPETDHATTDVINDYSTFDNIASQMPLEQSVQIHAEESIKERTKDELNAKLGLKERGNPRDFEKLSEHEQNQAILDYNRLFNIGLIIFIISLLFLVFSLIIIELIIIAPLLIFILWILSFVALNKVRRIDLSDQPKTVMIKVRLGQIVCGLGVAICILSLFGGLVLFVLWSKRII